MRLARVTRNRRAMVGGVVIAVGTSAAMFAGSPASASAYEGTLSTTGAWGKYSYIANGSFNLQARDPLTDGHCARWQHRPPGGSWTWTGDMICSATATHSGYTWINYEVRICRTGIGNCSSAVKL
jgi:hypothetical protein